MGGFNVPVLHVDIIRQDKVISVNVERHYRPLSKSPCQNNGLYYTISFTFKNRNNQYYTMCK